MYTYIVAELSLTYNSQYASHQLYGETNKITTRLLVLLEVWTMMPTSDLQVNFDKVMANNIVSASIQLLSSSDSSTDSLGKYIKQVFCPPPEFRLPTQSSSLSSKESPSLSSSESSSPLAVTTLSSLPPINIWLPKEGAVDYSIGHWLPYFDDCHGNNHFEKKTSNLWYHRQLGRREKNNIRCVLFLLVGCQRLPLRLGILTPHSFLSTSFFSHGLLLVPVRGPNQPIPILLTQEANQQDSIMTNRLSKTRQPITRLRGTTDLSNTSLESNTSVVVPKTKNKRT
jgi:hypothetical protein